MERRAMHDLKIPPDEAERIVCPYCKSEHTECVALFGPKLLTSQYYCRRCHSAFEVVRK
jgi:transposase-like protein